MGLLIIIIWVKCYLHGQVWLKDSCTTKAPHSVYDSLQKLKRGVHCTAFQSLSRLKSVLSCRLVGLNLLEAVMLLPASSRHSGFSETSLQLGSSESSSWGLFYLLLGGTDLVNLAIFREFLKLF